MPSSKKHALKAVLDANVWVSALLWGGKPAEIIKAAENHKITIILSEEIIKELSQVLAYSKLKKLYEAEDLRQEDLMEAVLKIGKFVKTTKKVKVVEEHPADNKFIECALTADAEYIVSGDKHLLKIANYKKTQMLTVNEFLRILQTK